MNFNNIKQWFLSHRRSLPWRDHPTPYRVWVSEVMLQQTQVSIVIPYFLHWMKVFPTIHALASASLTDVLKIWEGLGYYSRARYLHEGARFLVSEYGGELPSDPMNLAKIHGIGPYTQSAIRSFAFKAKTIAIDGNVLRVLSRFFAIIEPIDRETTRKKIQQLAENLLPNEEPWLVSEGLIELGALVCKKQPICSQCPLIEDCLAFRYKKTDQFPVRISRQKTVFLHRYVAIINCRGKFMIQKGEKGKIMADLYEFPYVDRKGDVKEVFQENFALPLDYSYPLPEQKHTFTHFHAYLYPHLFQTSKQDERFEWKTLEELNELPFSAGHKRILKSLSKR
ncbi:MAG: A/G-specific adenine glycosylase [Chlamydiales bacterium]